MNREADSARLIQPKGLPQSALFAMAEAK